MPSSSLQKVSDCTKYPGHEDFIPLKDFSRRHLRAVRQKPELYDLIKCQGVLTVKIKSRRRKKVKGAGKSEKHPKKQLKVIHKSTGFVIWVNKRTAGIGQSCHCDECVLNHKDVKHDEWYDLIIVTNSSTISNQHVADSIEVEISLNEEQGKTLTLKGQCKYVGLNEDICQLHFITCDIELGSELHSHFVQFESLLSNAFSLISKDSEYIFSFTVSHPHGCDKHVSFSFEKDFFHSFGGSGVRMMEKNKGCVLWPSNWNHAKVYYNVPTCAGSSGAIVITLTRSKGIIISLHRGGSKRYSWTKEKNVRHFSEFLKEDEEPDRVEDFGPMIQFPSSNKIERSEQSPGIEQTSQDNPMSIPEPVTVLQPRDVSPHQRAPIRIIPRRIVPRKTLPSPVIDNEIKDPLQKIEILDTDVPVVESTERILQLEEEPETTKVEPSASKDKQCGSVSPACHCNKELKTPESKPHPNNNEEKVSLAAQGYRELSTSESKASPNGNEEIVSPASQGHQEVKSAESKLSNDDNDKIVSQAYQVDQEPTTPESNPSPTGNNDKILSLTSQGHKELKTSESKVSPYNNEGIVSSACQVHQEPTTPESNPSLTGYNDKILPLTSQGHKELKTSESKASPYDNAGIVSSACQVHREPTTPESNPSPTGYNDNILPRTSQGYKELKTSESKHSPFSNEGMISSTTQSYQEAKPSKSKPSLSNNHKIFSPTSEGFKEPDTLEAYPSPNNEDRIVSEAAQGCIESKTLESNISSINSEGIFLSTSHAEGKFKPKESESSFLPGRDEEIGSLASQVDKKVETYGLSGSQRQEEKRHLPLNQSEENLKALKLGPTIRTDESGSLSTTIFDVTNPGMAESEVLYGPEAHLPLLYVQCEKNPRHEKFFHLGELKLDHLPEKHRDQDIFENIHHAAALTVKVKTSYVSRKRPEAHPYSGDPYLFFEKKGLKFLRVGTGFVVNVQLEKLKYGQTCQCMECESSESTRLECYRIVVLTATHVVFDQAEAKTTEIEFSYYQTDKEVTTKLLKGKCKHCVINEDACWLEFSFHDEVLVSKLREHLEQFQTGILNISTNKVHDDFVTIVSYPHGSTKQHISFGNILSETDILSLRGDDPESVDASEIKSGQDTKSPAFQFYRPFEKIAIWPGDLFKPIVCQQIEKVCYTTPTCRGSSGALVCVHKPGVGNVVYTHWGCGDEDENYNRSGGGTVYYLNDNQIFPS